MKRIVISFLISGMVLCSQVFAQQGNGKDKGHPPVPGKLPTPKPVPNHPPKPNVVKPQKPVPPSLPQPDQGKGQDKTKENQGKGHAYGKNKDSLQGRDFGQNRAAEAKSKHEAITNSESRIDQTSKTNDDTRSKIKQAKEKLELKKKQKQITDAEYTKKKKDLDDLEKQLNDLEKQNNDVKEKLGKEKETK